MLPQDLVLVVARYIEEPDDFLSFLDALPAGDRGPSLGSLVALATTRPASTLWPRLLLSSVASNRQRKLLCDAMRSHPCVELDVEGLGLWAPHIPPSTRLRMSLEKSHVDNTLPDAIVSALCDLEIVLDTPSSISTFASFLQTLPRLRVLRLECLWTSLGSPPCLEPLLDGLRQVRLESTGFSFQRGHVLSTATVAAIAQVLTAQSVRDVSFRSVDVTPETGDFLCAALQTSRSLQRLTLQESHTLVAALARTTRELPHLKHLALNDVSWRHLETFWSRLPIMKRLSTLHLWLDHGRLNDDEFGRFVSVLGQLQLRTLQLHAKNMLLNYPGRVALLLAALAPQSDLVALTLHFTMLSNDDLWTLAAMLPCAVATLDLRYNAYDDAGVDALGALLQRPALRHVALAETLSRAAQDRLRAMSPRTLRLTFDVK